MGIFEILQLCLKVILALITDTLSHCVRQFIRYVIKTPKPMVKKDGTREIVLITGGASGLGRMMALEFGKLGAIVVSVDINMNDNNETVRLVNEKGGQAFGFYCDLSNWQSVEEMSKNVKENVGFVSILINNAAIINGQHIIDVQPDKIEKCFAVNIMSHIWTIRCFLPDMIGRKNGHIVSISSVAGYLSVSRMVDYCSSKFAVVGLHEALTVELAELKVDNYIKTTLVCPYFIDTGMFQGVVSPVFPILEKSRVIRNIMNGILFDDYQVVIPWYFEVLIALKPWSPVTLFQSVSNILAINDDTMKYFTGRKTE